MSAFTIYAIVLTAVYLVYYTVVFALDQFGKKAKDKDDIEVIKAGDVALEGPSVIVDEHDDGSYGLRSPEPLLPGEEDEGIGDGDDSEESPVSGDGFFPGQGEIVDDDPSSFNDPSGVDDLPDSEDYVSEEDEDDPVPDEPETAEQLASYEAIKAVKEEMEAVRPVYQEEYDSASFAVLMSQPLSKQTKILRTIVNS